jgi:hypothetical protein
MYRICEATAYTAWFASGYLQSLLCHLRGKPFQCVSAYQFRFYAADLSAVVSDCTTINDIEHELARRGFFPSTNQDLSYISMTGSRYRRIAHSDSMKDLLAGPLSHFQIRCSFLGGSGKFLI